MFLSKIYRIGLEEELLQIKLQSKQFLYKINVETCFYAETDGRILNEIEFRKLHRILGDSWENDDGIKPTSSLAQVDGENVLVEIGPRLNFSTPWSSNCVSVCQSIGLNLIKRLERSRRYLITYCKTICGEQKEELISSLYDPMTEVIYKSPLKTFDLDCKPQNWTEVDVIGSGVSALEVANNRMGLCFDEWDLDYYTNVFCNTIKRNPTTVELFDLAQSNSEHSRHWFFKGIYELNGKKLPASLFELVMNTNTPKTTNDNNVIKFSDNSSGIDGWRMQYLVSEDPRNPSPFKTTLQKRHIVFTAETHNFPTGVSPFSGATTGTGGRIRDVQAVGRGGHVIAATVGYCFGNLHIPGYPLEWEKNDAVYPANFATPLSIAIEASNGASDYGNKFGEPVLTGFARSFGCILESSTQSERREWIKPIMFSGGIGSMEDKLINKISPKNGDFVVKVGGPVYRIGVGGGAASSVQVQGDNNVSRDFGAVQRGDAEMEQKLNRVIRGCLEMPQNPIMAIHDQGAGGNANVLKELMEEEGGVIYTEAFSVGDKTLSTLEIWGAEYQESNAMLVDPGSFSLIEAVAIRERCPIDKVGLITGDKKIRLIESNFPNEELKTEKCNRHLRNPVDLELKHVLGKMPQKVFRWTDERVISKPLSIPKSTPAMEALSKVLKLPSVASKRYLTNKVDRSVTGLIAQQQCVGPLHTPVADVAVIALSYFNAETNGGAATSIGEQPIKLLVDPCAGSRMSVAEAITNLAAAPITDLKDVKCSANWMWPAKLPGEGYSLYCACQSMCEMMKTLGIAVDGGKDSLSMAARVPSSESESQVVKSPGSLVISAYAPCTNITQVLTPDLKSPLRGTKGELILVKPAFDQYRVAGTALAQIYSQIGAESPDLNDEQVFKLRDAFNVIQKLNERELLLSIHDVSDGGLISCLIEMAISGWGGFEVDLPNAVEFDGAKDDVPKHLRSLFNEEAGWVLEVNHESVPRVIKHFSEVGLNSEIVSLGQTSGFGPNQQIKISVDKENLVSMSVLEAAQLWERTSFELEKCQMSRSCAEQEYAALSRRTFTEYKIPFKWRDVVIDPMPLAPYSPQIALIREEGTNGDRELAAAFTSAGFLVYDITMSNFGGFDSCESGSSHPINLDMFRGIIFPGGFSYADVLGSANGWAASIRENEKLRKFLDSWRTKQTSFSLGICNGCQLMAHLGWVGEELGKDSVPSIKLVQNLSGRFESRWSKVKIEETSNSILLKEMGGATMGVWVAHGEGRFLARSPNVEDRLKKYISIRYIDDSDMPTEEYPFNPNGSKWGVAGVSSECGHHLALMPHPERCYLRWQQPFTGNNAKITEKIAAPWCKIFQNAFDWCLQNRE